MTSDPVTSDPALLRCRQLADELKRAARRAVGLHQQVSSARTPDPVGSGRHPNASFPVPVQLSVSREASASRHQMVGVLQEAFGAVSGALQGALQGGRGLQGWPCPPCSAPCGQQREDRQLLLEKYSEELVQLIRNKLDRP